MNYLVVVTSYSIDCANNTLMLSTNVSLLKYVAHSRNYGSFLIILHELNFIYFSTSCYI